MRLWHEALIPYLSTERLLGQHRECCALRGKGWGRKHKTVDYVFKYSCVKLYLYHCIVMNEMKSRGFHIDEKWRQLEYRGKNCTEEWSILDAARHYPLECVYTYPEHDEAYLKECLKILFIKRDYVTLDNFRNHNKQKFYALLAQIKEEL